jgi:glycosyltransferase involved in cell wall biosynthesis
MWNNKKITVILPAYNEEKNIKQAIDDFYSTNIVDEILVIDNNSTDNTKFEIERTQARRVVEDNQGYGWALRRGLREATGDYIFTCEPDGTFIANDIFKFLQYADEFDVIYGSRTSKSCIWENANMGLFLRYGNVAVAKLLEYIHNGPCLTDVGCTFKFINKSSLHKIIPNFKVGGSHFSPEFMIITIRAKLRCIEIPINYKSRIGVSKITGSHWKAFKLGLVMILLIFARRIK